MHKPHLISFLVLLFLLNSIQAQLVKEVSLALQTEAIGLPFTNYSPAHPGFEAGLTLWKKEGTKSIQTAEVFAGGFYHKKLETGFYLRGNYQYTFKVMDKLGVDLPVGVGYMHTFYPADLYEQDPATGEFETISQTGRPHALITAGIGLSYLSEGNFQPFIKQELAIETPFANSLPVITHSFLKAGVKIKLAQ